MTGGSPAVRLKYATTSAQAVMPDSGEQSASPVLGSVQFLGSRQVLRVHDKTEKEEQEGNHRRISGSGGIGPSSAAASPAMATRPAPRARRPIVPGAP